ncbi:MAG TPA: class II fumarate hydratase, partial [Chloroflexota bacterium]|nr:class II fumarate hydratase [Chloroflexota bacterium]
TSATQSQVPSPDGAGETRLERDSMGELPVPSGAYYGASTQRAVQNFPISPHRFQRRLIRALGLIKRAGAETNRDLGLFEGALDPPAIEAMIQAAQEVADGRFDADFVVDVYQTGSGTSSNMNANEVIANRANELLGQPRGTRKPVHPNDHVNLCQSSNDVIPTAIHVAALMAIKEDLVPALEALQGALTSRQEAFWPVIKTGRTHLQDATPIRLGQEFLGYAGQVQRAVRRLGYAQQELGEVALGGTAVGTGINAHPEFAALVCARLESLAGVTVRETENHFQAQAAMDGAVAAGGVLNTVAVSLLKIANDVRLLGSGPRAGLFELLLPEVQPGSSIMPGKVNPVIAEALIQVCAQVMASHQAITLGGQWGFFELNTMMPLIGRNLLEAIELLSAATANFATQCVAGLQATETGPRMVEQGLAICTALAPAIGYDAAAAIAKEAYQSGKTVRQVARERTSLSDDELERLLNPEAMTEPGLTGAPMGG